MLLGIALNAGEKLIDSMSLHNTGYSYRSSWFLSVIAEEEMAKLIMLPFANLADRLDEVSQRPSIIYKHPVKHRVFTSYGIQNRTESDLEKLKQEYMYAGVDSKNYKAMPVVKPGDSSAEIVHAVKLYDQIVIVNFLASDLVSDEFKQLMKKFIEGIFIPAVKSLHPAAATEIQTKYNGARPNMIEAFQMHPLMFAELVMAAIPADYKTYFKEIEGKSFDVAVGILDRYLDSQ